MILYVAAQSSYLATRSDCFRSGYPALRRISILGTSASSKVLFQRCCGAPRNEFVVLGDTLSLFNIVPGFQGSRLRKARMHDAAWRRVAGYQLQEPWNLHIPYLDSSRWSSRTNLVISIMCSLSEPE